MRSAVWIGLLLLVAAQLATDVRATAGCRRHVARNRCTVRGDRAACRPRCCTGALENANSESRSTKPDEPRRQLALNVHDSSGEGRLAVELEVENTGNVPVAWDRECAAFLRWEVSLPDGTELEPTTVERVKDGARDARSRFVILRPGERFRKKVVLSESVPRFVDGLATTTEGDVPIAYEDVVRFDVPADARGVRLKAHYECVGGIAGSSFRVYFGVEALDIGFQYAVIDRKTVLRPGSAD
jgi:hypothetical protein